jgi:organic hydroperoxide reductase OsmC/OhrA
VQSFPHVYSVSASSASAGNVVVSAATLPDLETAAPPEFDGPGGYWSPESLLCAAVADCFILSFRAFARGSRFEWLALACRVVGTLDRVGGVAKFTHFATHATLTVAEGTDTDKARLLLAKAEHGCLISNSLSATRELASEVVNP